MFAVKLAKILRFAVSEESTVKCLEGSSDLFVSLRKSSAVFGIFGSLLKPEINCRKMAENFLIY